mmetsp:Transcript_22751/g.28147  ORF Transcript_22751/g.28147 Transcript_22751/m.28147 type:complete len:97 (-) Transcript_22751:1084-1374(-)
MELNFIVASLINLFAAFSDHEQMAIVKLAQLAAGLQADILLEKIFPNSREIFQSLVVSAEFKAVNDLINIIVLQVLIISTELGVSLTGEAGAAQAI